MPLLGKSAAAGQAKKNIVFIRFAFIMGFMDISSFHASISHFSLSEFPLSNKREEKYHRLLYTPQYVQGSEWKINLKIMQINALIFGEPGQAFV